MQNVRITASRPVEFFDDNNKAVSYSHPDFVEDIDLTHVEFECCYCNHIWRSLTALKRDKAITVIPASTRAKWLQEEQVTND
jgi:hypothetical protein